MSASGNKAAASMGFAASVAGCRLSFLNKYFLFQGQSDGSCTGVILIQLRSFRGFFLQHCRQPPSSRCPGLII